MHPLEPLKWHLRALSALGGLPVAPADPGLTLFEHTRWGWARIAAFLALYLSVGGAGMRIIWDTWFDTEVMSRNGFLLTDTLVAGVTFYLNVAVMAFMIADHWRNKARFDAALKAVCDVGDTVLLAGRDARRLARKNTLKLVVILSLISACCAFCYLLIEAMATQENEMEPWERVVLPAFILAVGFTFMSPVVMATHLVMYQLFGCLSIKQKCYSMQLGSIFNDSTKKDQAEDEAASNPRAIRVVAPAPAANAGKDDIHRAVGVGVEIQKAATMLSEAYGGFAFLESANSLYTAVTGVYLGSLLFLPDSYDDSGTLKTVPFYYALFALFVGFQGIVRYYNVMNCGQEITVGGEAIKRSVEDVFRGGDGGPKMPAETRSKLEVVRRRCSGEESFRPLDTIAASYPSGISALGTFTSYVIVLLQFKVIESRSRAM